LDGLLQPGNRAEDLECAENQIIIALVIQVDLAQGDPPETPEPRDCKCLHGWLVVEVTVVLAPVNFRPRSLVFRALDCPALQVTPIRAFVVCRIV
jgi:hypothetical protein